MTKKYLYYIAIISGCLALVYTECCGKRGIKYMPTPKQIEQAFERTIQPQIAAIDPKNEHGDFRTNVFMVPFQNAVGTFDLHNSFSLIKFEDKDVKVEQMMKYDPDKFPYDAHDKFGFLPVTVDEIYYWANKGLNIFNFKEQKGLVYLCHLNEDYVNVTLLNSEKNVFFAKMDVGAVKYKIIKLASPLDYNLGLTNGGHGAYDVLAEKLFPHEQPVIGGTDFWIQNKTIFVFDTKSISMLAFNDSLAPVQHPLASLINSKKINVFEFAVHPKLPFAVAMNSIDDPVTSKSTYLYVLIRWQLDDEKARITPFPLPLIKTIGADTTKLFLFDYQFSPDGKWLLIKDGTKNFDNPDLFVYPIDEKDPLYLGQPWYLGHAFREGAKQQSSCWIVDPCSYVVSDGMCVYKWEMPTTKQK